MHYLTTLLTLVHMYPHHLQLMVMLMSITMAGVGIKMQMTGLEPGVRIIGKTNGAETGATGERMSQKINGIKSGMISIMRLRPNGITWKIDGQTSGMTLLLQIQILIKFKKKKLMNQSKQELPLQSKNAVVKQLVGKTSATTSASSTSRTQSML